MREDNVRLALKAVVEKYPDVPRLVALKADTAVRGVILTEVGIFGRGKVCTQLVAGAELAQPYGFKTIDEAVHSSLEGARYFAKHGVTTTSTVMWVAKGSVFYKQQQRSAPLEYYVWLARGLGDIRRAHCLGVDFNDYRRCAIHPDTDLSRLDYHEVLP